MIAPWRWFFRSLPVVLAGCFIPNIALADLQQVGSWFVVDEHAPDGRFSHCLLFNAYYRGGERVVLAFSLSPQRQALFSITDPALARRSSRAESGTLQIDKAAPLVLRASGTRTLLRLDLPPWEQIRAHLATARTLHVSARGHQVSFGVHDIQPALASLESCAATGKPPLPAR